MIEACEQSGRGDIPTLREPILLQDFLDAESRPMIAFHTDGATADIRSMVKDDIVACVGPEGGWADAEIELFEKKGATLAHLDLPVLRAETAAIVIATLFLYRS